MKSFASLLVVTILICFLLNNPTIVSGRRGRGKARAKAGLGGNRLPVGAKWRDTESAKYYTNNDGAKIIKASHFDLEYILGHKISFMCIAVGNPRPQITWYKDGVEIYAHQHLMIHEWREGEHKLKSKMEIDPGTQMDAGIYECYADNKYHFDRRSFRTDFLTIFD